MNIPEKFPERNVFTAITEDEIDGLWNNIIENKKQ